jgi:hypothetical protein
MRNKDDRAFDLSLTPKGKQQVLPMGKDISLNNRGLETLRDHCVVAPGQDTSIGTFCRQEVSWPKSR